MTPLQAELVPFTRGNGIELAPLEQEPAFPHFRRIVGNVDWIATGGLDFVYCDKMLKMEPEFQEAIDELFRVVKVGGHVAFHLDKHDFDARPSCGWSEIVSKDLEDGMLTVYRKRDDERQVFAHPAKHEKTCAIFRAGAFGDMVQMSSILPELKRQGYHVKLYTTVRGYEIAQSDPLIDEFVVLDDNQVPNIWLTEYFQYLTKTHAKFVNLCESVEGTFLTVPGRPLSFWPKEARHAVCDKNYVEMHHMIAGLPFKTNEGRFVATDEEKAWAKAELASMGGFPRILWATAGSSLHKVWPYMDAVIARILIAWPHAMVTLAGDGFSQAIIEPPWAAEPRVHLRGGVWTIRQTLAVAQQSDIVIGPETGVMSAVAMLPMPKVVLLSHSTVENLTRDWQNCYAIFSTKTECWPCHKLIHTWADCNRDEATGVAKCQADIPADAVWAALTDALKIKQVPIARVA